MHPSLLQTFQTTFAPWRLHTPPWTALFYTPFRCIYSSLPRASREIHCWQHHCYILHSRTVSHWLLLRVSSRPLLSTSTFASHNPQAALFLSKFWLVHFHSRHIEATQTLHLQGGVVSSTVLSTDKFINVVNICWSIFKIVNTYNIQNEMLSKMTKICHPSLAWSKNNRFVDMHYHPLLRQHCYDPWRAT